jgi:dTDP-4-amino-4,6-dideoxygalactose transaminase
MLTVGRPNVANRERFLERVNQILDSKIFTNNGPFVQELEELACSRLGVAHCIAVCNATIGLELLFESLKLQGEVITPSLSFVATAHALVQCGLTPVFCDIDPQRHACMSASSVLDLVTEHTAAIMPVNVYGFACDLRSFSELSKTLDLPLIYDSAHGLGVDYGGVPLGGFGRAEVFSLHATKFITGFEGGLITTNSSDLADELRSRRNFGFSDYDCVTGYGTNAKLSEIHAAMALTNLEFMDDLIQLNSRNYHHFKENLSAPYQLLAPSTEVSSNYQYVPVRVPSHLRDRLAEELLENGVFARRYFYPGIHKFNVYKNNQKSLPETERLCGEILCLPTGQDIELPTIEKICKIMSDFAKKSLIPEKSPAA